MGVTVETLLVQNSFNVGLHRPNFVSAFSDYVFAEEFPMRRKIHTFTKLVERLTSLQLSILPVI